MDKPTSQTLQISDLKMRPTVNNWAKGMKKISWFYAAQPKEWLKWFKWSIWIFFSYWLVRLAIKSCLAMEKLHTARGYKQLQVQQLVCRTNTCCRWYEWSLHWIGAGVFLILIDAASSWTKPNTKIGPYSVIIYSVSLFVDMITISIFFFYFLINRILLYFCCKIF